MDFIFNEHRLTEYAESELISHILSSPCIPGSAVFIISPNLVAKHVSESEVADELEGIRFAQRLRLPVPGIKRVVREADGAFIIMSRIHGRTMEAAWPKMSWLSTIYIAFQLQHCVRVMRCRTSPTAGSLVTGKCNSIWLEDYYGLPEYATPEVFSSFIQFWLQYKSPRNQINARRIHTREIHKLPATRRYFVFTHQDLAPRNLLLDEQNNLWLVDWERSGWYPDYFEYTGMQNSNLHLITLADKLRWWLFCWISVGIYRKESRMLETVKTRCMRRPLARKSIVLQEGAHFDAFHLRKPGI